MPALILTQQVGKINDAEVKLVFSWWLSGYISVFCENWRYCARNICFVSRRLQFSASKTRFWPRHPHPRGIGWERACIQRMDTRKTKYTVYVLIKKGSYHHPHNCITIYIILQRFIYDFSYSVHSYMFCFSKHQEGLESRSAFVLRYFSARYLKGLHWRFVCCRQ